VTPENGHQTSCLAELQEVLEGAATTHRAIYSAWTHEQDEWLKALITEQSLRMENFAFYKEGMRPMAVNAIQVDKADLEEILRLAKWAWSELSEGTGEEYERYQREAIERAQSKLGIGS
jgi:hypothetical protein